MEKKIFTLVLMLLLTGTAASIAQDVDNLDNPNNSSYPPSNQLNALPNEPDHTSGTRSIHKIPADVPHKNVRVIYDRSATEDKPAATQSSVAKENAE